MRIPGKTGHVSIIFMALLAYFVVVPQNAYAYVDPGTGSYVFQVIVAALLGAGFAIKLYWRKIKGYLSRSTEKIPQTGEDDDGKNSE